jgi:hypothetical protein
MTGFSLLVCVLFMLFYVFVPGGDGFYIFCFWMVFLSYGIASLCQILMFEAPTDMTPTHSGSSRNKDSRTETTEKLPSVDNL